MNAQGLEVMYELRVLSGLHQGAVLPLMGERWSIGASDEADLALYDPGIESMHAHLYYSDGHWSLQAQEGLLHDETGAVLAHIADLQPGNGFSIGCIRLCLDHAESDWPAEPEHRPGLPSEPGLAPPIKSPAKHWKKLLTGALALLLLVFAGIALLAPDELQEPTLAALQQSEKRALATAQDVHRQLQQMLRERELQTLIGFNVEPHQVTLNGEVFKEQMALISRMLDRFQVQFSTPVAIINRVRETDSAPPFTIVQIMGGKKAHVVFADGRRLFYGDEIDGLRLTLIDNHRMLFEGKQRYEVSW